MSYRYNGDNLLYERIEAGVTTRYYYDGEQVIAEANVVNGVAILKNRYLRGQSLISTEDYQQNKAYYLQNGHGDIIELRDETGNTQLNQYSYDIWGNTVSEEETVPNSFHYSGELWDPTTSLQYLRARWYDPSDGRFINEDTYEGELGNPLSQNLYTYVHNNPLRWIDPLGHWIEVIDNQLSPSDQFNIRQLTDDWYKATTKALKDNLHSAATRIRQNHFIAVANAVREEVNDEFWEVIDDAIPSARSVGKKITKNLAKKVLGLVTDDDPTFVFRRTDTFDGKSLTVEPRGVPKPNGPKARDDKALSMNVNAMLPGWMTTLEGINATGLFTAIVDNPSTGHVSVVPTMAAQQAFGSMNDWLNSYNTANESAHFFTNILTAISIRIG